VQESSCGMTQYLIPFARVGTPNPYTQDQALGEKYWDWVEGICKDY